MNFKTNKRKFVAKIMLLVLLVTSAFSFTGCGEKYKYKFPASYDFETIIAATAYSDTNVFDIDNVTLTLSYSLHELDYFGRADTNPKEQLPSIYQDDQLELEICVCNGTHQKGIKDINCCVELKTIEEKKLFSQEYGHIDTPFFISNGIIYKHSEIITIPSYMFTENAGKVYIRLLLMEVGIDVWIGSQQVVSSDTCITINYKKIDNNTIELDSPYS